MKINEKTIPVLCPKGDDLDCKYVNEVIVYETEKDLYELRVHYITTKSELMAKYKRSTIENTVQEMGISSSLVAPKIIESN